MSRRPPARRARGARPPRLAALLASLVLTVPVSARAQAVIAPPAVAEPLGTLEGLVTLPDRRPAELAEVRIASLRRGTLADSKGRYRLTAIPPGEYRVEARLFGREPTTVVARVEPGVTTTLEIRLGAEQVVVEVPVVDVPGRQPKVQKEQIGPRYNVGRPEIEIYRPMSVEKLVETMPGVVNAGGELHVEGGRADELRQLVGGIQAYDPLGGRNAPVALAAIANVELVSGGVNPEHGNALSGVIDITTREGGSSFGGDLRWDTDRFGEPAKTYGRLDRLSLAAGGPTPFRGLTWFATYEGTYQDGYPASGMSHPKYTLLDFLQFGNRQDNRTDTQWKLAWTLPGRHKLTLEGLANRTVTTPYVHSWSRRGFVQVTHDTTEGPGGVTITPRYGAWSAVPVDSSSRPINMADHVPTLDDRFRQVTLAWRYLPMDSMIVNVRLAAIEFTSSNRVGGKEPWEYDTQSPFFWNGNQGPGTEENPYFATHGDYPLYSQASSRTWTLKGDWTNARLRNHRLKVGAEAHLHRVQNLALTFPNGESSGLPGAARSDYVNEYPEAGFFVHDLWRFEGLILSTGLRYDVFSPGSQVAMSELPSGKRVKSQWSPRLGVSYPVSDRDALSFHYGWIYQTVSSMALFENRGLASTAGTRGNPDLEPQTDVSYRAALQHLFTRDLYGQFSVFFRDIYGLLTVRPARDEVGNQIAVWANGDYASSRGFEASLVKSFSQNFSADVSYTYSIASGVASDPAQAQQFVNGGQLYLPISESALRWDQRHTLGVRTSVRVPGRWGLNAQWGYGSGLPFTPQFRSDRRPDPKLENSRRLPSQTRLDLSGDRFVKLWGQDLTLFADVRNALDAKSITGLAFGDGFNPNVDLAGGDDYAIFYTETGRPGGAYLQDVDGDQVLDWVPLHDPRVLAEGRSVKLGIALRF